MAKPVIEIKSYARQYTKQALKTLAHIMAEPSAPHASRVAASVALLDRGWGKPTQAIAGEDGKPLEIQQVVRVIVEPKK